jgi:mannose-1-phosphate guanylyltransferase
MIEVQKTRKPLATLDVSRVPDPRRCGIVDVADDGISREFVEKPEHPKSNLAVAGILLGTPAIPDFISEDTPPADIGSHLLPRITGRMMAHTISQYLLDIGTLENYEKAQSAWLGPRES